MRNLVIAWGLSLILIGSGAAYIWSVQVPESQAAAEPETMIVEGDPPVLSSGALQLDLTPPAENPEDCVGTC